MSQGIFQIVIPASTSNIGPGFDCLGLALSIYNRVRVFYDNQSSAPMSLVWSGTYGESMPSEAGARLERMISEIFTMNGQAIPHLRIEFEVNVPLFRGLGSSSTGVLAAYFIAHHILSLHCERSEILSLLYPYEGHPDNLSPSLFGGLTVSTVCDGQVFCSPFEMHSDWKMILIIPDHILPTKKARNILPESYCREDVIFNLSRLPLLLKALKDGDEENLHVFMQDRLHQSYRASLMKYYPEVERFFSEHGVAGTAISGAGSAIIAFTRNDPHALGDQVIQLLLKHNVAAEIQFPLIDMRGTFSRNIEI